MPKILSPIIIFITSVLGLISIFSSINTQAASFKFNPPTKQFLAGCTSGINILVDTEGEDSNAADIEFYYNPSEITILDSVPNIANKQIKPGDAYESYFGNIIDETTGKIVLTGGSFVTNLNGNKTFATVEFQSKPGITTTNFTIKFDGAGATRDSNVAEATTSDDLLTSIGNGTYTFATGNCTADTQPPKIFFQTPKNYDLGVALNNKVTIKITDNQSGVDLNNLVFTINGDTYKVTDPEVIYAGNPLDYTFTINPRNDFYPDKASSILVNARDIAGNKSSDQIVFNIPPAVIKTQLCPAVGVTEGAGGTTTLPSFPFLPRTGGFSGEVYTQKLSQEAKDESLSRSDFVTEISGKPVVNNWFFANFFKASLRTLQLLSFIGVLIFVLSAILSVINRKYRVISSVATDKLTGQLISESIIKLFNATDFCLLECSKTNSEGKFTFKVRPGSYIVQINDGGNIQYQEIILAPQNDNLIFLKELPETTVLNLESKTGLKNLLDYIYRWLKSLAPGFYLLGLIFAIFNFILIASLLNLILLIASLGLGLISSLPGFIRAASTFK
ncbi:MAG: hypothetical protein WCK98_00900 [bacterium]